MSAFGGDPAGRYLDIVVRLLPAARHEWGCAMRAELATIDRSAERWHFALGCTRAALLQTVKAQRAWRPVGVAAAVGLVLAGEIALSSMIGQIIPGVLVLILLVWLGGRPGFFGPVRAERAAQVVRVSGYTLMGLGLLILAVGDSTAKFLQPGPKPPMFVFLLTLYAGVFLATTTGRAGFGGPGLGAGTCAGLVAGLASFVVMPFERIGPPLAAGLPWHGSWLALVIIGAPAAAAVWTTGRTGRGDQGIMAALCAGAFAALLVALLGLSAIALFPDRIPDIVGPVMVPGTSAAQRQAADATEAADPYIGLLLFGALLAVILWVMARPPSRVGVRSVLLALVGIPPVALGLSARHFPGATGLAVATAMVVLIALAMAGRDPVAFR
ncbi:hypothetical protein [Frankia sp. Cr2]|uniref:hypothetical protein n=1 Tax=Frankia sp. Cr2 TaxID=3073932 RepID=UPI002AD3F1DE|nr:hypothetical protein [Frankia sp. Cr2]